ncbi:glycosyltransferase family 4 protein [Barnesiella sp. An55]|uniref:glycosyltransferase family 4 protein n=1 Tax=Barnesiella sp. An55 TaxID=1965646 RepID=UPI000B365DBC|nr:glycosyltransferase family 4 protein [Barnesiella sp. An55]OUN73896.1 hypothetical protein B5G10_02385 [Barnesiella sp. An55]HIZ26974.1 glycosyltransferase family 4 protein [Candidatus Barnesiella merdipullorum]
MKILLFSHGKQTTGDAEQYLLDLIKGIKQARGDSWEIYVVFPGRGELWETAQPYLAGYTFIRQPWWLVRPSKNGWHKRLLFNLRKHIAIYKTRRYIRRVKPQITFTNTLATPIGALASQAEKVPHDWLVHEIPELARNLVYLFGKAHSLTRVNALSQKIIVTSDFVANYYAKRYLSPEKIAVIYQPIEAVPPRLPRADQPFTLGMLGNFEPNKGQHIAIEALRKVVEEYPETHLLLIGDNESRYAQELKEKINNYKLDHNVSIVEHTIHPNDYLIQADAAIVCSRFECSSRTIIEELKCGLPVIAPDKPFGKEVIREGYNGYLYSRDDVNDLTWKIIELQQANLDELRKNALKSVEHLFPGQAFAEEFISITNPPQS